MKNTILLFISLAMFCAGILSSCGSVNRLTYLKDVDTLATYVVPERPDAKIAKGDRLSIVVTCKTPALAAPFNVISGASSIDSTTGEIKGEVTTGEGIGYTVDKEGFIDFPILGRLKVEGITLLELREMIAATIKEKNFIKDPIVAAEFLNFTVTVLGEVGSRGNYLVKDRTMTIFEAIARANDMTTSALRDEVWVIRTEGNSKKVYPINLQSKSCFSSPAFYLQQNDVVYVRPRKGKLDSNAQLGLQISSLVTSSLAVVATILSLTGVFNRK